MTLASLNSVLVVWVMSLLRRMALINYELRIRNENLLTLRLRSKATESFGECEFLDVIRVYGKMGKFTIDIVQ